MRPFTIVECEQRSEEWVKARLGRVTSSGANELLSSRKDKTEAAGRRNLRMRLVLERITGRSQERDFQSAAMADGVEREPEALVAYEAFTGNLLSKSGFLRHNALMIGASLDGHTDDFSLIVEAKSPLAATHWDYIKSGKVPTDYLRQVTHQLFVTGADACDWFSYNPDFPPNLQVKLVTVKRKDVELESYEAALRVFLAEVDAEAQAVFTMADFPAVLTGSVNDAF